MSEAKGESVDGSSEPATGGLANCDPSSNGSDAPPLQAEVVPDSSESTRGRRVEITASYYEGPIPHPEILRQLDNIVPGSAKLIIHNSLDESKERRENMRTMMAADNYARLRAMNLGAILAGVCLIVGCVIAIGASPAAGATVITGTVVTLASCQLLALRSQNKAIAKSDEASREVGSGPK